MYLKNAYINHKFLVSAFLDMHDASKERQE